MLCSERIKSSSETDSLLHLATKELKLEVAQEGPQHFKATASQRIAVLTPANLFNHSIRRVFHYLNTVPTIIVRFTS